MCVCNDREREIFKEFTYTITETKISEICISPNSQCLKLNFILKPVNLAIKNIQLFKMNLIGIKYYNTRDK